MNDSTNLDPPMLDLERDLPTTSEDCSMLHRLRMTRVDDGLVKADRLVAPGWALQATARPTFEGVEPFELES